MTVSNEKSNKLFSFGTVSEELFIRRLGDWSGCGRKFSRVDLLLRYKEGLLRRTSCPLINRDRVLRYLDDQIANEHRFLVQQAIDAMGV